MVVLTTQPRASESPAAYAWAAGSIPEREDRTRRASALVWSVCSFVALVVAKQAAAAAAAANDDFVTSVGIRPTNRRGVRKNGFFLGGSPLRRGGRARPARRRSLFGSIGRACTASACFHAKPSASMPMMEYVGEVVAAGRGPPRARRRRVRRLAFDEQVRAGRERRGLARGGRGAEREPGAVREPLVRAQQRDQERRARQPAASRAVHAEGRASRGRADVRLPVRAGVPGARDALRVRRRRLPRGHQRQSVTFRARGRRGERGERVRV